MTKQETNDISLMLCYVWLAVFLVMLICAAITQSSFYQRSVLGVPYLWVPLWRYLWCPLALAMNCKPKGRDY